MAVTVAPSTEACIALVDRINAGTTYVLDILAKYSRVEVDPLEEIDGRRIDVVHVEETQLNRTFALEDQTSHKIAIWVREKLKDSEPETIDALCLLVRQIYQRVNNWDSDDDRVRVWETDEETRMTPDKMLLNQSGLFVAVIVLRVEVEASP
jgi:uncharacterized protein YcbX